MSHVLHDLLKELERYHKELGKLQSTQLNSQSRREALRQLVEVYFQTVRSEMLSESEQDEDVATVDGIMQELLALCHKRGLVSRYRTLLSKARKALITIDMRIISFGPISSRQEPLNIIDIKIIDMLDKILSSAALSYKQALLDLRAETRFSWRGPATDLREALRETLDYFAPDSAVEAMQGYKQLPDTKGPTMQQKMRHIMKSRGVSKSKSSPTENATDAIENAVASFVRSVYTRSSVSTHTPTEKNEVLRVRDFVRIALCELLEIRL
ncbi:hypothetical protein JW887_04810 [Candidatus Dojkabacteria bacterium]|nr:hypothetical protein [Candidatus Dojkabacteria bacterium]